MLRLALLYIKEFILLYFITNGYKLKHLFFSTALASLVVLLYYLRLAALYKK